MKIQNRTFLLTIFLIILNLSIFLIFYLLKIPSMIVLNPIVIIFSSIELILFNIFSSMIFIQYLKYKKKIFGEILKFKITLYLLLNILGIFLLIVLIFSVIDYSPSISKIYDNFNFLIEENYLKTIDKINEYKTNLNIMISSKDDKIFKTLLNDRSTLFLKYKNKIYLSKLEQEIIDEILSKKISEVTFYEKDQKGFLIYNDTNYSIIYNLPDDLIISKNQLFSMVTLYKMIYSQKKNSPIITFLALFLIIIPFLLFQVYFLFKYISKFIKPIEIMVSQFKKVSSNSFSPIPLPKKRFDEFAFLIIQFNRLQKQLEQRTLLLKYQERFEILAKITSKFAHEIKNPLTPIVLSCELIQKKYPYDDNFKAYLFSKIKVIQENVESIRNSINKFYSYSEKNSDNSVSISMKDFLQSLANFWNSDWIDIKLIAPSEPIFLYAQKEEIESVFNNLIINSYEASKIDENQKCKIIIKITFEKDNFFSIFYSDSGSGIILKDCQKIFEPYYTTKENGSGFGLAIVKSIIENTGGTIEFIGNGILDENEYSGATFLIKLPLHKQIY